MTTEWIAFDRLQSLREHGWNIIPLLLKFCYRSNFSCVRYLSLHPFKKWIFCFCSAIWALKNIKALLLGNCCSDLILDWWSGPLGNEKVVTIIFLFAKGIPIGNFAIPQSKNALLQKYGCGQHFWHQLFRRLYIWWWVWLCFSISLLVQWPSLSRIFFFLGKHLVLQWIIFTIGKVCIVAQSGLCLWTIRVRSCNHRGRPCRCVYGNFGSSCQIDVIWSRSQTHLFHHIRYLDRELLCFWRRNSTCPALFNFLCGFLGNVGSIPR